MRCGTPPKTLRFTCGSITIGCAWERSPLPGWLCSPTHWRHYGTAIPKRSCLVDLGPVEGITLVADHALDLALIGEYAEPIEVPPGVELVALLDDPIYAVLPAEHPLAAKGDRALRLADFAHDAWACAPAALPNRRQLEQAAKAEGFSPNVPFESESYAVAEAVVSAGVAVAFIPRLAISDAAGTVRRRLGEPGLARRIHAAMPTSAQHTPLTAVFLRLLQDLCAELRSGGG